MQFLAHTKIRIAPQQISTWCRPTDVMFFKREYTHGKLVLGRLREKFRRPPPRVNTSTSKKTTPITTCHPDMAIRKIWVKKANASATQVAVGPDDLVDDVRDAVIRKYLNSLGRTFDAPDVSLRICPSERTDAAGNERILAPDEPIIRLIEAYYPKGQTIEEALVIDVPQRRTPRPSPRPGSHMPSYYIPEERQPVEAGDYFPPMPALRSPHLHAHGNITTSHPANSHLHSIAVLSTGQVPSLTSPGGRPNRHRPKAGRPSASPPIALLSSQASSNLSGMMRSPRLLATPNHLAL